MVVENIQICGVQVSGKWTCKSRKCKWKMDLQVKKMKVDIVAKAKLSPMSLSSPPRQKQITHPPS